MTETLTAPEPTTTTPPSNDIDHLYCGCDPNLGLCGVDLTDVPECADGCEGVLCVVCREMVKTRCAKCGEL